MSYPLKKEQKMPVINFLFRNISKSWNVMIKQQIIYKNLSRKESRSAIYVTKLDYRPHGTEQHWAAVLELAQALEARLAEPPSSANDASDFLMKAFYPVPSWCPLCEPPQFLPPPLHPWWDNGDFQVSFKMGLSLRRGTEWQWCGNHDGKVTSDRYPAVSI